MASLFVNVPTLALYKRVVWWDIGAHIIRWWTDSPYSHSEIVIDDTWMSSSIPDGGVRAKQIPYNPDHWDLIPLPWAGRMRILSFYRETKGTPYGWSDLIKRQLFNHRGDDPGYFCSEWCAAALGIPDPEMYSPAALADYCNQNRRPCSV